MESRRKLLLDGINSPADIKALTDTELELLSREIRELIIKTTSENGGHLASNLGVVELSIALHRVFNSPKDKIIWDVGHQAYVHKIITGRKDVMPTLRKYGGISGFTRREESEHDPFGTGHSSTAISAAVGIAAADKLHGNGNYTIAVVGDGSFTGGMVFEALNNCENLENLVIVLNDNDMSISPNVGNLSRYFGRFRSSPRYFRFKHALKKIFGAIPLIGKGTVNFLGKIKDGIKRLLLMENIFESLGLMYYGPIDGNNSKHLEILLKEAKADGKCSVVHICTKKGQGYIPAEEHPDMFHSVGGFDINSGKIKNGVAESFSDRFGSLMTTLGEDTKIAAITAAMCSGTGLDSYAAKFPDRFFDVGIAEQHATTFAAGLATQGFVPVFSVYSTFFQRAYDQLLHDVALQELHCVFALDRAGLVFSDGATHHGVFDVAFMNHIPGLTVYSPDSFEELEVCLKESLSLKGPAAVRYPRGTPKVYDRSDFEGKDIKHKDFGKTPSVAVITYGRITFNAVTACLALKNKGIEVRLIKLLRIKPIDFEALAGLLDGIGLVYIIEEGIEAGGVGSIIASHLIGLSDPPVVRINAICDRFVPHGSEEELYGECGFLPEQISEDIAEIVNNKRKR